MIAANVRTVADLLEVLADVDPSTKISWHAVTPDPCCPGHYHDINDLTADLVHVYSTSAAVEITLKELTV